MGRGLPEASGCLCPHLTLSSMPQMRNSGSGKVVSTFEQSVKAASVLKLPGGGEGAG